MATRRLNIGQAIPLRAEVSTGSTTKVVKASIYNDVGTLVGGPVTLTSVAEGLYKNDALTMPSAPYVLAVYSCFEVDGTTPSVDTEFKSLDIFEVTTSSNQMVIGMSVQQNQITIGIPLPPTIGMSVQIPQTVI